MNRKLAEILKWLSGGLMLGCLAMSAPAATFTWTKVATGNASGSWTNESNWSGGTLPTTTNDTADFSSLEVTNDSLVTLDGNQRINTLLFGDTATNTVANWMMSNSTLTIEGVSPTLSVNGLGTLSVYSGLGGSNGLTKTGNGVAILRPTTSNTLAGTIVVAQGTLRALRGPSVNTLRGVPGTTVVYADGTTTTGGQLSFNPNGNATISSWENIVVQGPGESGLNVAPALEIRTGIVSNYGSITLNGTGTYRLKVFASNIQRSTLAVNGGIARSNGAAGTLALEIAGTSKTATNALLAINSPIKNNGGLLVVTGANAGTLLFNTNGHDFGDVTIKGASGSASNLTTLRLGLPNALPTNINLNVTQGMFDLGGYTQALGGLTVSANGSVSFAINRTNVASASGYLTVRGEIGVAGGGLVVSNAGPALQLGDRIRLFNQAVPGFTAFDLPAGYRWANRVAADGSIEVISSAPQTYYVSPQGADTNAGTLAAPFKTLAAAVPMLNAGDTLWVRGGTYRETLNAVNSGTTNAPITIAAYGSEVATISGCDVVAGPWTALSNGIYFASVDWDLGLGYNQIFVDGVMQHQARHPNFGTNDLLHPATASITVTNASAAANPSTINSSTFGGKPDGFYAGARFYGGVGKRWAWQTALITNSSGKTLFVDSNTVSSWWWPDKDGLANTSDTGVGFVYGLLSLLDADGEWHVETNAVPPHTLYSRISGQADPTTHLVEMKRRNWCVDFHGQDYVVVRGLKLRAGAVNMDGAGDVLSGCEARFLSHYLTFKNGSSRNGNFAYGGGVVVGGANNTVSGCTIFDTAGSGILASGDGTLITRNHVYNIDYSGTYALPISVGGSNEIVTFNTLHDAGRDILRPGGTGQTVMFNDLYGAGKMCLDLGIIYTYGTEALGANGVRTRIAYNWIHGSNVLEPASIGVYLDNGCRHFVVDHNVCWDFGGVSGNRGIYLNSPAEGHEVHHNTLFDCTTYNAGTYTAFPTGNPDASYWGTTNHHLFFTAQNNLVLSNSAAVSSNLVNAAARDFRLKTGSAAIDPPASSYVTSWSTTNGVTGVPANFHLGMVTPNQYFAYQETGGYGVLLAGINEGYVGAGPDNGAYESGGFYWTSGTNGVSDGLDANGDGVPDSWQTAYFGSPTAPRAGGAEDFDLDGFSNWQEYVAGANPTNANSLLRLSYAPPTSNGLRLNFTATRAAGVGYSGVTRWFDLLSSTNLSAGQWTGVPGFTNLPGTDQTINFTNGPGPKRGFYRLRVRLE